jgi:hypothetical protein
LVALYFPNSFFQFPNDPIALIEWFIASVILIVVVTLLYVYVLNKSPPTEGVTVAKLEASSEAARRNQDPTPLLLKADTALKNNNLNEAVESSAEAVSLYLRGLIEKQSGPPPLGLGISDLAYLVQTRAKAAPQIADPAYQLNNLRLKAAQNQPIDLQQASWAVSFAKGLAQTIQEDQIKF